MSKNEIGQDSPIPKFIYLKIRRRDGVESLTILEEGEFKVPIDGCIRERCKRERNADLSEGYITIYFERKTELCKN